LRIALVNSSHAPGLLSFGSLRLACATLTGIAGALAEAGASPRVFQSWSENAVHRHEGIDWELVRCAASHRPAPRRPRLSLDRRVAAWAPDVVHLNGLHFAPQAAHLRRVLRPEAALVLQHHAERPPRPAWKRWLIRHLLAGADGFLFSGAGLAGEWREARVLGPERPIFEVLEGSTRFSPGDRAAARARSEVDGSPAVLWVGHLDANKDPLTVLAGVERLVGNHPRLRLHMAYRGTALLGLVRKRLAASRALDAAVRLAEERPPAWIEDAGRAADLFVLGSHREGSGYAAVEAMATGAVPVLTDIPAFRFLTDGGRVGSLWRAGDAADLARALGERLGGDLVAPRAAVRARFEEKLSFSAIARDLLHAYSASLDGRRGNTARSA
jgi:glycosyltransferase involved in cell wall biosynthesis